MAQLIQRVPAGLLSLLGLKAGGVNPSVLSDTVQPMLDLSALYGVGAAQFLTVGGNVVVGLFASTLIVPDNEVWYVRNYTVYSNGALGAGVSAQWAPAYFLNVAGATRAFQVGPLSNLGAVGNFVSSAGDTPFLLPPSSTLGVIAQVIAAGPVAALFAVDFARLPI
jgi:hypothetical protein